MKKIKWTWWVVYCAWIITMCVAVFSRQTSWIIASIHTAIMLATMTINQTIKEVS